MITIEQIREAAFLMKDTVARTPLVPLPLSGSPAEDSGAEIHLKLETRQPIGSFKIRGAFNRIRAVPASDLLDGVWTASAGNMAQGVAWVARRLGIACTAVVPDTAPKTKLRAIEELGGKVVKTSFDTWWSTIMTGEFPGMHGTFVHPCADDLVIAGNGTIGLEILEDMPETDTVLIPWGGGGLACGIASAFRALRPKASLYAAEVATAAPLSASLAAGEPTKVDRTPSFVDSIGGSEVIPRMFARVRTLLDGALIARLEEIEAAIRALFERTGVVAEGAGACPVAIALSGRAPGRKVVCVVSGGNIDRPELDRILGGGAS